MPRNGDSGPDGPEQDTTLVPVKPSQPVPSSKAPTRRNGARQGLVCVLSLSLILPPVLTPLGAGARAQAPSAAPEAARAGPAMSRAEYEACQAGDEAQFRQAVDRLTAAALKRGLVGLDYPAVVAEEWRRQRLDDVMARQVDLAIGEVREETSWTELIGSIAFKDTAQRLATTAAERVFRSDGMRAAIEGLAGGVGKEVGNRIERAITDAADPVAQCVQAFLGPRYGATVARAVSRDTGREFTVDAGRTTSTMGPGKVISQGGEGIAGTVLLIVRRQLARIAAGVGQRIVGVILSRIVGVVAGGIGIALIAKDIWEFRHGVLPIIASEMKSTGTRDKIQAELARVISEQIGEHVQEISAATSERVVEIWREFRRAHAKVLEIAEKDAAFRRFLDTVAPARLPRLDEVVALTLTSEGEAGLMRRIGDGTLHRAVEVLPPEAMTIARDVRSLEAAFKWTALAGDSLPRLVEHGIHRIASPDEMSKPVLDRILALGDPIAIERMAKLTRAERSPLMELAPRELTRLARALGESDLKALSGYLTALDKPAAERLVAAVAQSPAKMASIASVSVREAILASRDQAAAVGLMVRAGSVFDFLVFGEDVRLVRDGKVSPALLWARYPVALSIFAGFSLVIILLLWRLIFGRRPRIVVAQQPRGGPHT